jgi:hypothetical protein
MCYARFEVWSVNGRESWTFLGTWCEPNNSSPASPATAFSHESTRGLPQDTKQPQEEIKNERQRWQDCANKAYAERDKAERAVPGRVNQSLLPGSGDIGPAILAGVGAGARAASKATKDPRGALAVGVGVATGSIAWSLGAVPIWRALGNLKRRWDAYYEINQALNRAIAECNKKYGGGHSGKGGSW